MDLETGAVVAVTVQPADEGDTRTYEETLTNAAENIEKAHPENDGIQELVADKGYHSNETLVALTELEIRTYISEPDRGRRNWKGNEAVRDAVYENRRRIRGERGRRLLRSRGERLERPFAHAYETGRLRRVHLRGRENILKRVLVHTAALNLGLLMRVLVGVGTPRSLQGRLRGLAGPLAALFRLVLAVFRTNWSHASGRWPAMATPGSIHLLANRLSLKTVFTTGC